jgi:hypothetical protein
MAEEEGTPGILATVGVFTEGANLKEAGAKVEQLHEEAAQEIADNAGQPVTFQSMDDKSSTTYFPQAQNGRSKSFSVSVSAARYAEIFGHTGFKQ